jgi:hypothetical protein
VAEELAPERSREEVALSFRFSEAFDAVDQEISLSPDRQLSPQALEYFCSAHRAYAADLLAMSALLARRQGVDSISVAHVNYAVRSITPRPQRKMHHVAGLVGGLLLGAFLQEFLQALAAPSGRLSIPLILAGVIGMGLIVYQQAKS